MTATLSISEYAVNDFFQTRATEGCQTLAALAECVPPLAEPDDDDLFEELTRTIHHMLDGCELVEKAIGNNTQLLSETKALFREAIRPWFEQSWFMHRATVKPRGYPGDFETLIAIYDGRIKSRGFGGYLDRYFLGTDLGRAVPARLRAVKEFLCQFTTESPGLLGSRVTISPSTLPCSPAHVSKQTASGGLSILNVACGPGREYDEEFFRSCGRAGITVVDTDDDALAATRLRFVGTRGDGVHLQCVKYSALKMTSPERNIALFGRPDLIYSVGLCDYIPDRYLIKILKGWRETVAENGIVYVAFKDVARYRPSVYQWLVDWNFYGRTEADCVDLMRQAGFLQESLQVARDETGVIINFIAGNNPPAVRREPQQVNADQLRQVQNPVIQVSL